MFGEKMKRVISVALIFAMVISGNGFATLAGSVDEVVTNETIKADNEGQKNYYQMMYQEQHYEHTTIVTNTFGAENQENNKPANNIENNSSTENGEENKSSGESGDENKPTEQGTSQNQITDGSENGNNNPSNNFDSEDEDDSNKEEPEEDETTTTVKEEEEETTTTVKNTVESSDENN